MCFDELCRKEVICVKDCRRLGRICNLEIDCETGHIHKIIVREKFALCNFFSCGEECVISFKNIIQIGPDIILVEF